MLSVQPPLPADDIIVFSCYFAVLNLYPFPFSLSASISALPAKWVLWTLPNSNSKNRWLELFQLVVVEEDSYNSAEMGVENK